MEISTILNIILIVITGVYVILTNKIANISEKNIEILKKQIVPEIEINFLTGEESGFSLLNGGNISKGLKYFHVKITVDVFNKNVASGSFTNPILEIKDLSGIIFGIQLESLFESGKKLEKLSSIFIKGGEIRRIVFGYGIGFSDPSTEIRIKESFKNIKFLLNYKDNFGNSQHLLIDRSKIKNVLK